MILRSAAALAVLVVLNALAPSLAAAQSSWLYELRGCVLAHDVPIVAAGKWESGVNLNAELAFATSLALFGGAIRPVLGGSLAFDNQTSYGYLDARWEWTGQLLFLGLGVGPAVQSNPELYTSTLGHKALGSRVLFHVPLELGVQVTQQQRLSLYYEHVSNAYTAYPNPGMDNIGVRIAHRF